MRFSVIQILLLIVPLRTATAQTTLTPLVACNSTCTGNLGENIFPDGDFGQGAANVLPYNPGLAPGYIYQFNPPPDDGAYTITNNTSNWGGFASNTWIDIMDNGPEPNGYMMVVNASFQPGLFYEKTVSVCENTLYEFSIDVISVNESNLGSNTIKPNVAFLIDSVTVCETGNVPIDEKWHTYRFSFTTAPGQTVATLSLRNNAPGGYGNDLAIDNISFRACGPKITLPDLALFCDAQPLTLQADLANSPYTTTFYQWQVKPGGASTWSDVPNATDATLAVNMPASGDQFRLVAANSMGNLSQPNCRSVSAASTATLVDLSDFAITGEDTIVCNGALAILEGGIFTTYQWSTGQHWAMIQVDSPGWYAVTVTTNYGCTASDSMYVYEIVLDAAASWSDPLCFGDSSGVVSIDATQGGVGTIRFSLDGSPPQTEPFWDNLSSGQHLLMVSDSLNCRIEIPFTLTDPPRFEVSLGADRSLLACDTVVLGSTANFPPVSYQWQPPDALSCTDCPAPVAMPLEDITYSLTVKDALGCVATDSLSLVVLPRLDVYAPNVFIQDLSGSENNYFTLYTGKSATLVRRLSIYDRWGELVFDRKDRVPGDLDLQWDGADFRGKKLDSGVFVWVAEIEFTDGVARQFSGDVTLWRRKN